MNNNSINYILSSLNPRQLSAVQAPPGPLLVSAGAGSGKTKVLTCKIAYLIGQKKIQPQHILAITFTNKAAKEMQNRVSDLIQHLNIYLSDRMWISTFHSMCARILRDNKNLLSTSGAFTIYDTMDQLSLVKKLIKDFNLNEQSYHPKMIAAQIAAYKRQAKGPNDIDENDCVYGSRFPELYHHYEQALQTAGAYDFEGLLFETYKFFLKFPEHLERYRNQFLHIFVDEYQDTNQIQYLIVKKLAEKHKNICVVGDEDQSIYSWRGANISNILNFDKDFPKCQIIKLEQNYRSTKTIISAASSLIQHNSLRKHKQLFTNNADGTPIQIYELTDEHGEAYLIANIIADHCYNKGYSYKDFAIFYRTNAQSRVLEDALRTKGIPYKVAGGLKFYDRAEIKDILAYLNFILNNKDETSLRRIINTPRRGIGNTTIDKIAKHTHHSKKSFYETMTDLSKENFLPPTAKQAVTKFIQTIEYLKNKVNIIPLSEFYKEVLNKTNYARQWENSSSIEAASRLDNLQELANVIAQFETENKTVSLEDFLETMALLTPSDADTVSTSENIATDNVTLMTFHVSKGLEFDVIFMSGMEEGLFPVSQSVNEQEIEEERRLAYVGMTRAKRNLIMSYAMKRHKFGTLQYNKPSQFLHEIPEKLTHFTSLARYANKNFKYPFHPKKHTKTYYF